MPDVKLPSTVHGWAITLVASMVGFVAGTAALSFLARRFGG